MRFKPWTMLPAALLAGCSAGPGDRQPAPTASPATRAAETITASDTYARIAFLADDALRGRDTPSPGLEVAAAYIASEFRRMGLEPAGENGSYLQRYPYPVAGLSAERTRFAVTRPGGRTELRLGEDFYAIAGAADSVEAAMIFTGTDVAPDAEATLGDKVAVVYLPGALASRDVRIRTGQLQRAAEAAGARAVVFVVDPSVRESMFRAQAQAYSEPRRQLGGRGTVPPSFFLRYDRAREVFRQAGLDLDAVVREAEAGDLPPVELPGVTAVLGAPVEVVEPAAPPNVVAMLPGSDPALRDSYVIFSAHMDHVGVGEPDATGDSIYNGADDDASGTAAVLEMAEAFASLPEAPARSVVFLLVSGEEKGLLGSRWYSDHPTVPIEKIVANVNMDMVGRNAPDSIVVIGQEYSSLGPLVLRVAAEHPDIGLTVSRDIWPEQRFFFRSDHFNFARKEIPSLFFFAGVHEDYHRPSDEAEKIDAEKAARVSRLAFYTAYEIATAAEPPRWTEEGLAEIRRLTR